MHVVTSLKASLFAAVGICWGAAALSDPVLVMVEQPGCIYCQRWDAQIAPAYPNTDEGKFAPLMRTGLRDGPPDGMTYARRVVFTPTFILVEDGEELARIEGYPGEDFFWPVLSKILKEHTDFAPSDTIEN
ncbi:thioredoxin fold domain-containing protein [Marivita sp. S2033]|uniref:thioredoxin fold domain-containing protein n=1 Tax=Marivita sp. S2033 TaxID=3373187 RepID=UPI003982B5D5